MSRNPKSDYGLRLTVYEMSKWRFIKSYCLYTWGGLHRYFGNQNTMPSEHERAVHYFTRAYEVDPTFRMARLSRAILLGRELGQPQQALADLDALLAEDPDFAPARLNRGLILQGDGRYREALSDLEQYLAQPHWHEHRQEAQRIVALLREILAEMDDEL